MREELKVRKTFLKLLKITQFNRKAKNIKLEGQKHQNTSLKNKSQNQR